MTVRTATTFLGHLAYLLALERLAEHKAELVLGAVELWENLGSHVGILCLRELTAWGSGGQLGDDVCVCVGGVLGAITLT